MVHGPRRRLLLSLKRAMDVTGALLGLVLLAPVIAWTALAIAVTMGRPILFRQARPGLHGRPFTICKFRTMRSPRRGEIWYATDDQRMTRLGRFLRASSIDELPELWNVLRGDMSLVGPRPLLVEYLVTYSADEARRHDMRPGITGWAAVNGRHTALFDERLRQDTWYVDNWSLALDLRIILMTIGQVVRRADAQATQDSGAIGFRIGTAAQPAADATQPGANAAAISPEPSAGAGAAEANAGAGPAEVNAPGAAEASAPGAPTSAEAVAQG